MYILLKFYRVNPVSMYETQKHITYLRLMVHAAEFLPVIFKFTGHPVIANMYFILLYLQYHR